MPSCLYYAASIVNWVIHQLNSLNICTMYTVNCTVYTVHCTVCTVHTDEVIIGDHTNN